MWYRCGCLCGLHSHLGRLFQVMEDSWYRACGLSAEIRPIYESVRLNHHYGVVTGCTLALFS